jgi:hypothetical protein
VRCWDRVGRLEIGEGGMVGRFGTERVGVVFKRVARLRVGVIGGVVGFGLGC